MKSAVNMNETFSENMCHDISDYINHYTGLYFPENKHRSLMKGITLAARELGFEQTENFIERLTSGPPSAQTIDVLVRFLTIGETYFFRNKAVFQTLKDEIFRGLLTHPRRDKKHISIWSAGCASGEEPYSIAILIDQMTAAFRGFCCRYSTPSKRHFHFAVAQSLKASAARWRTKRSKPRSCETAISPGSPPARTS